MGDMTRRKILKQIGAAAVAPRPLVERGAMPCPGLGLVDVSLAVSLALCPEAAMAKRQPPR